MHGSFLATLKPDTNNEILNMIIEYYHMIIENNRKLKADDWKLQMNKNEWEEFYSIVVNRLKKIGIKERRDEKRMHNRD